MLRPRIISQVAFLSFAAICITGCVTHYRPEVADSKTQPTSAELTKLSGRKFNVPLILNVRAPNDMVGRNDSIFDGTPFGLKDIYHYPLRKLLSDSYNKAAYKVFLYPEGEISNAFELKVEPACSQLLINGRKAKYKLSLYVALYSPKGRLIYSNTFDEYNTGNGGEDNELSDVVYSTIRGLAIESLSSIAKNQYVRQEVKIYEER